VPTTITGLDPIPSYTGKLKSPLRAVWLAPSNVQEIFYVTDSQVRGWVRDAAAYHDVPHELAAVILQQENSPKASGFRQFLQFGERSVTTFGAIVDKWAWDMVPDKLANGSSGLANMKRSTLEGAAKYTLDTYKKPALPDEVRQRLFGWSQDNQIPGDDFRADVYFLCAHLRELIDRVMKAGKYSGPLTLDQVEKVCASYNGSGKLAAKYGKDARKRLEDAAAGREPLYFYEK
jgi:hypothetical protein